MTKPMMPLMTRFRSWEDERWMSLPVMTTATKSRAAAKMRRVTFSLIGPTLNVAAENASELPDQHTAVNNPQSSPMKGILHYS